MCGLVGAVGKLTFNIEKMFKLMLQLDTVRGPHSTGILNVTNKGDVSILKKVGSPYELAEYKAYDTIFTKTNGLLLGHNRFATQGAVNNVNAHPFECGHIYGAHNGTLKSVYNLLDHTKFDVDSENIFHNISIEGAVETIKKLDGAFALTWYDSKEGSVNLVRNDERPLYYVYTKEKKTVLWASEKWTLIVASDKCGVDIGEIKDVPVGHLHTFKVPECAVNDVPAYTEASITEIDLVKKTNLYPLIKNPITQLVQKGVEFFVIGDGTTPYGQTFVDCYLYSDTCKDEVQVRVFTDKGTELYNRMVGNFNLFSGKVTRHTKYAAEEYLVVSPSSVKEIELDVCEEMFAVGDQLKTRGELVNTLSQGCAWCTEKAKVDDFEDIEFLGDGGYLCPDCASSTFVQGLIGRD